MLPAICEQALAPLALGPTVQTVGRDIGCALPRYIPCLCTPDVLVVQ